MLHGLSLRILGNAADAEEVLMDVFEQVWRKAHTFDPARASVWSWLVVLTRSRAVDRLRSTAGRRMREQPVSGWPEWANAEERAAEADLVHREQQEIVRRALSGLPAEQREPLELAYFSGMTHAEIAARLGAPLGTIKTRIRIGMDKLRAALYPKVVGSSAR